MDPRETADDIIRLTGILNEHEVLTKDSAPSQVELHPYTRLVTDLIRWKAGQQD